MILTPIKTETVIIVKCDDSEIEVSEGWRLKEILENENLNKEDVIIKKIRLYKITKL